MSLNTATVHDIEAEIRKGTFVPHTRLTNLSMAYFQGDDKYVSRKVFPIVPVQLSSSFYYEFLKGDLARNNVRRKPQMGKVEPAVMGHTENSYQCYVDQVITGIDEISALDYSRTKAPTSIDPRRAKARFIAEQMNLALDIQFAKSFFNKDVWKNTLAGADTASEGSTFIRFDDDNCDPIELIDNLKLEMEEEGRRTPNKLSLGAKAFKALKNNPTILERVKYGGSTANPALVTENVLAQLFGIDQVLVFKSTYNAAAQGQPDDMQFICNPNDALLTYTTNSPAIDEPSAGYIFAWDMLGNGQYMPTLQWPGENGTHTEFMEGLMAHDMKKTSDCLATYLSGCVR
ncbi:hypothetical protein OBO34_19545 [Clostridiales Family XIII bacterium ASD5510]|uniref:Major capsid protein n=1 Tax=Hominibacterium faecale TaxID=2839743 RepID=A0A9J6QYC7_9FIRM|nr:hypothetical protein [Hominibacterium faecale]MCU7380510.1 hypothetical protein [Hominibacterium faecale]